MRSVAITGFGVVSPVGSGCQFFWQALIDGRSGIDRITRFDCSTFDVQLAGEVKQPPQLPAEIAAVAEDDLKVGFAYAAAREALAQADVTELGGDAMVHLGASLEVFHLDTVICNGKPDFTGVAQRCLAGQSRPFQMPLDVAARTIADAFGRPARVLTNCSACAAGAQAIGHGFRSVRSGEFELAVCGGFDSMINPLGLGGFQILGALTTDTERGALACRPFDASRSGTVLGEGAAVVVLEPLGKAQAEGKPILAEICGYGSSLDAHNLSAPDPEGDGAARAMLAALEDAQIAPEQIGHINAHGTGTLLNDEVEAVAIRRVFTDCWHKIPVSSTKSVTGHLIAAAGAVEVGACLLAFSRNALPANPSLDKIADRCELAHVVGRPLSFDGEYVLTNSFGFGGQNASLVLRRYDG